MKKLEEKAGRSIPKDRGSGQGGHRFVRGAGGGTDEEFCKMHFKTAYEAMGKNRRPRRLEPKWKKGNPNLR